MARTSKRARLLRAVMDKHSLTAVDIAKIVSREPQTVRTWLCHVRNIPLESLLKVMRRYEPKRIGIALET